VYGEAWYVARRWVRAVTLRQDSFFYSNKLRYMASYIRASFALHKNGRAGIAAEVAAFARAYARKRRRIARQTVA
jgi:hypothetical protein